LAKLHVLAVSVFVICVSCFGQGQDVPPDSVLWFHPNQEIRVTNLPSPTAPSTASSVVLATALETIFHDKAVCCGKNSALEDAALSDPSSLKELSAKLQGKHYLSDGRTIAVHAEFVPQDSINSGLVIGALQDQHALLMQWKSNYYVLYGAIFNETRYASGMRQYAIVKLLLQDVRFSDERRETEFKRETDDLTKVQGLLTLAVERQ
jgi:hypothetical protein